VFVLGVLERLISLLYIGVCMSRMSISEVLRVIESLEVGNSVRVKDKEETEYSGNVVEIQRDEQERRWLVKGDEGTDDHVLHVTYDIEGGPVEAEISFEDGTKYSVYFAEELA
jgi:hypothetical protein